MYKVFIVDDDYTVRMDLGYLLGRSGKYKVVGEAENGEVALERIRIAQPDIILLDIEMPVMDGLAAIPLLFQSEADYKIVVLSCHDDYDNVRLAMRLGASEYLLKQRLEEDILFKTLDQMAVLLDEERSMAMEHRRRQRFERLVHPAAMTSLVNDLIQGHLTDKQLIRLRIQAIRGDFSMEKTVVICLRIEDLHQEEFQASVWREDQFVFALENIIGEIVEKTGHTLYGKLNKQTHYLISGFSDDSSYFHVNNFIYGLAKEISSSLRQYLKLVVTVGVSQISTGADAIADVARQAYSATEHTFYKGNAAIIHNNETEKYRGELDVAVRRTYIARLLGCLQNESESAERVAFEIADEIKLGLIRAESVKMFHQELLAAIHERVKGQETRTEPLNAEWPRMSMDNYGTALAGIINHVRKQLAGSATPPAYRSEIVKALEFLDRNYGSVSSLNEVAAQVHLNKSYFSQLFKKEMNESFTDYLTRLRIDKAKNLLSDNDMKIYEVALRVGIPNYRYFCKVFKEVTDLTPMEFRKQLYET